MEYTSSIHRLVINYLTRSLTPILSQQVSTLFSNYLDGPHVPLIPLHVLGLKGSKSVLELTVNDDSCYPFSHGSMTVVL